jgi:signal peptidase II
VRALRDERDRRRRAETVRVSAPAEAPPAERATAGSGGWRWLILSVSIIVLDQLSKWYIVQHLKLAEPVHVLPVFDLTLLHNTGAAFSFLANESGWQRWFFTALALGVSALIVSWLFRLPRAQRWTGAALGLVVGGALGNVIDRMRLGYVIDFIHVHWQDWYFPAFNVADSAISIGAVMLAVEILFSRPRPS